MDTYDATIASAFLVGAIPVGILTWPLNFPSLKGTASINAVMTIVDGVPTLAGWLAYLEGLGTFGAFGATGGLAFWLTLKFSGVLAPSPVETFVLDHRQARVGIALASVAVIASASIAAIPGITKDRSCHNMFRDGRRSVAPKIRIDLDADLEAWPSLTTLLEEFGPAHGMTFRNSTVSKPDVRVLGLSACNELGLVITADEQRWASRNFASLIAGQGVLIGVFDLNDGSGWQSLASDLIAALESEWPGKVRFRDGSGRLVALSTVLGPQTGSSPSQ